MNVGNSKRAMHCSFWIMKKLLLSSAIVLGLFAPSAIAQQWTAVTVASVGDGDTIRVKEGNKVVTVRLACIDAAEMAQKPYGESSSKT
jgi:micrococcal nuclease